MEQGSYTSSHLHRNEGEEGDQATGAGCDAGEEGEDILTEDELPSPRFKGRQVPGVVNDTRPEPDVDGKYVYRDHGRFGYSCMSALPDYQSAFYCYTEIPIKECLACEAHQKKKQMEKKGL